MTITSRFAFVAVLFSLHAARAQPGVTPAAVAKVDPQATTAEWGGGIRLTGLSGIGALPGVNYGAEIAGLVRRDELFAELGLATWRPEKTYMVTEMPQPIALSLDVWSLRVGWASMRMPLRGWVLAELGEIAGASGMQGVVTRMVMGDTPGNRQWRALGAGLGVAWPVSEHVRLLGNLEVAVPVKREGLMVDRVGVFEPDPMVARYSVGVEVGWR